MKVLKIALLVLVVAFIAIQFVPRNMPENKPADDRDIVKTGIVSEEVQDILKVSCYDCHSNETHLPWYSKVAPSAWLLSDHIKEGREHLNFSEWADYSKRKQISLLEGIQELVESEEMPLKSYLLIHRDAEISAEEKQKIDAWTGSASEKIIGNAE